ncbi:MAG TPA: LysR family transcriptional regulator [Polyangiaceae bacterium]|nr:LysR family transcriptional regulator [Polyangiaceae bacterium]
MELDTLRLFIRAEERGNLSAAARELGWLPATASAALKRLEQELGGRLFDRTTRSLRPTQQGKQYLERARQAVTTLNEARELFQFSKTRVEGLIRLSAPVDIGEQLVVPALDRFLETHSRIELALQLSDQMRDLWRDDFDAAIRYGTPHEGSLVVRKLAETRRVLVAAPSYVERHGRPSRIEHLNQHECLLLKTSARSASNWRLVRGKRVVDVKVKGRRLTDSGAVTRRWALAGHGITLKSWLDICEDVAQGRLLHLLPDVASESYPVMLATASGVRLVGRMRALGDWLADAFADRITRHPVPFLLHSSTWKRAR